MKDCNVQEYSLREIEAIGSSIAKVLSKAVGECGLIGGLGAGKTTLVASIVKALGFSGDVVSPTFVLENVYVTDNLTIEHWDLYRLREIPEELLEPPSPGVLRLIEWADKFGEVFDRSDYLLSISVISGQIDEDRRVLNWLRGGNV